MVSIYKERAESFNQKSKLLQRRLTILSLTRLISFLLFIFFIYQITQNGNAWLITASVLCFAVFLILVKMYGRVQQQKLFYTALINCNRKEDQFLQTNQSSYSAGKEFEDPNHAYSYDLDLFSDGGLFSYLNRCSTSFGKQALAADLLNPNISLIKEKQDAVKDLASRLNFRQSLFAYGHLHQTKKKELNRLLQWIDGETKHISNPLYYILMLLPVATTGCLLYYLFTESQMALSYFFKLFVFNLIVAGAFSKTIAAQLSVSTSITKILQNYSKQLQLIEKENFQSSLLQQYQRQLKNGVVPASQLIAQLASLFNYLETVINLVVSLFLNGLFLFHIHILYKLGIWKKQHAYQIKDWLEFIGKFEALGSFANLSYNNPKFCFPQMKSQPIFHAKNMGHLLVSESTRVCNHVSFNQQKFIILTGSNMSGKSTFLRTLGINLVLAKAGSAVCAAEFEFFPFEIFISMRITDSLQSSESLFYAELKRLQSIIKSLEGQQPFFVILDEILRGTNSNDKRNGTIGLIKKIAGFDSFGIIATHDIVVTDLAKEYPQYIANKAFESAIINNELLFDYQLKDGVCNTLNASYLMKKMGII